MDREQDFYEATPEHFRVDDRSRVDGEAGLSEAGVRKLVREEMVRNYRPKSSGLSTLLWVLVGSLLGLIGGSALILTGAIDLGALVGPAQQTDSARKETYQISLNQESTVENAVAKKATPSIVGITTLSQGTNRNPFFYGLPKYSESVGSGVIVSQDGYILTNSHVVDNGQAEKITVLFANSEEAQAKLVWNDPTLDLAIIKVEKKNLQPIELAPKGTTQVGDKAIAIGNPLGLDLQSTLTSGYISGLNRSITVEGGNTMDGLIQTDAAINSGNSGGALLNAKGQLVGLNTAKPAAADGIGFAIPISTIQPIVEKIVKEGTYEPLYLGVTGYNVAIARQMGAQNLPTRTGVIIHEVVAGSPAAKAKLNPNDILVDMDGKSVDSMNSLKTILLNYKVGDHAKLTIFRGGEKKTLDITFEAFQPVAQEGKSGR